MSWQWIILCVNYSRQNPSELKILSDEAFSIHNMRRMDVVPICFQKFALECKIAEGHENKKGLILNVLLRAIVEAERKT